MLAVHDVCKQTNKQNNNIKVHDNHRYSNVFEEKFSRLPLNSLKRKNRAGERVGRRLVLWIT